VTAFLVNEDHAVDRPIDDSLVVEDSFADRRLKWGEAKRRIAVARDRETDGPMTEPADAIE
jgi:hypothetical protein